MKMYKKIVFVGAAGVGKTSLLDAVCKKDQTSANWTKIPEVARQLCEERGFKSIYDIKDHEQFRLDVLDKQIELENQAESFIADRSTIDCWTHYLRWSLATAMVEDAEHYYQKAKAQAEKYDLIIFVPKTFETPDDGFRWANDTYQIQIERIMKSLLYEWDLLDKTYTLKTSSLEDRIKELYSKSVLQ